MLSVCVSCQSVCLSFGSDRNVNGNVHERNRVWHAMLDDMMVESQAKPVVFDRHVTAAGKTQLEARSRRECTLARTKHNVRAGGRTGRKKARKEALCTALALLVVLRV